MFGFKHHYLLLVATFFLGTVSCSDAGFDGGAGSFSGGSTNKASKKIVEDEIPDYICVRTEKGESFSESVKRAKEEKNSITDRERGKRCKDGFTEATGSPDGDIREADDSGSGGLDGGVDSGGVDSGGIDGDSDSGGEDEGDDEGGDDDGIDWDNTDSAKLREPMKITQTEGDEDTHIKISFVTSKGNGEVVKVDFKEKQKSTKDAEGICAKRGTTTVKIIIASDEGNGEHSAGQREDMKWTRLSKNGVRVHTDLDGCGFMGQCLDKGQDNGYTFECKNSKVKVEGLGI